MRSLSRKAQEQKDRNRVDKYITENYEEVIYEAIAMNAGNIIRQTAAEFLKGLSMHGYGAKRLQQAYEWFLAITNLHGKPLGKSVDAEDCISAMEKYGIDFSCIAPEYQSYEDFCMEREQNASKNK